MDQERCRLARGVVTGDLQVRRVPHEPWATVQAEDFQHRVIQNTTNLDQDRLGRGSKMSALVPRRDSDSIRTICQRAPGPSEVWGSLPRRYDERPGSRFPRTKITQSECPRQDSNLRSRLRRAVLYPLS